MTDQPLTEPDRFDPVNRNAPEADTGRQDRARPESREAMHPQKGAVSIRRMIASSTWHLEHHAKFLTRKLDRMLGPVQPAPARKGGCSSGCGCG